MSAALHNAMINEMQRVGPFFSPAEARAPQVMRAD
jgi:hypothetical protein